NNTVSVLDGSVAYCADAGASDAYACSLSPAPASYVTGARYRFKANTANTGAATINLNSLGAKAIKKAAGGITTDLADNDIRVGQVVDLVYDGTNMQMQSTLGNAGSGLASINGDSTAAQVIAAGNGISITDAGATHTIAVTGEHLLSTTTVNTNVGTKQALYTVPVGKHCIVTKIVVRSVSASLGAMSDALSFGFDVDAGDFNAPLNSTALSTLTDNTLALTLHNDAEITLSPVKIGSAGNVFGCFFNDTSITATVVIDVFGYLY
ncbi:MAG TPA: hypothetical protein VK619_01910, partial [Pyrinomonadaceae bacterium]|nr:hypothetical protein [Pyrinomonadaceae bacterium]